MRASQDFCPAGRVEILVNRVGCPGDVSHRTGDAGRYSDFLKLLESRDSLLLVLRKEEVGLLAGREDRSAPLARFARRVKPKRYEDVERNSWAEAPQGDVPTHRP